MLPCSCDSPFWVEKHDCLKGCVCGEVVEGGGVSGCGVGCGVGGVYLVVHIGDKSPEQGLNLSRS